MMPWYIRQRNKTVGGGKQSIEHAYTYTTKRLPVCGSCDKELRSSLALSHRRLQRDPTAASARALSCHHTRCTTQKPLHPPATCMCASARNAVRLAMSCFAGRASFCCLFLLPSPHASSSLSAEGGGATKPGRTSRKHVGGGSSFQDCASPHPFPIHFDYYYLIGLSSLFPSCWSVFPCSSREPCLLPTIRSQLPPSK